MASSVKAASRRISGAQCRAARALLNITKEELAAMARVSRSTIEHIERDNPSVKFSTHSLVFGALERRGVRFVAPNGGGEGVRLAKPSAPAATDDRTIAGD